jgi:hypothetical protein
VHRVGTLVVRLIAQSVELSELGEQFLHGLDPPLLGLQRFPRIIRTTLPLTDTLFAPL